MFERDFADMTWLFSCDNHNRGILRQNFDEAAMLWRAVRASDGPILEIGRRHGGSTVLLLAAGDGRRVTSIDLQPAHHHECQSKFDQVLSNDPDRLHPIVGNSRQPLPGSGFGFVFIDGDHSYEGVKADTVAHWSAIKSFGTKSPMVVYHDAVPNAGLHYKRQANHCEGVAAVCRELVESKSARVIESAGSSVWLEKLAELPANF